MSHIDPCPNSECRARNLEVTRTVYDEVDGFEVSCRSLTGCGYIGPTGDTEAEAIRLHNLVAHKPQSVPRDRLVEILEDGAPGPLTDEKLKWIVLHTMPLLLEEGAAGTLGLLVARLSQTVSHYRKLAGNTGERRT